MKTLGISSINHLWYHRAPWSMVGILWPFSKLFQGIAWIRRQCFRWHVFKRYRAPVPVIVVGNITVGGTGKTPLVIALAKQLQQQGLKPGIVSRGYRGQSTQQGCRVIDAQSTAEAVGDEAVLLARQSGCPVVVGKKRSQAVQLLLETQTVDSIISDDGLQHYALHRDIEIALLDGKRRVGNGHLLPLGPLRESVQRLQSVDYVVTSQVSAAAAADKEYGMTVHIQSAYQLSNPDVKQSLQAWQGKAVHAVAGVGHPERFFNQLRQLGLTVIAHAFPDHYAYQPEDLQFSDASIPILMTEKDAVKCEAWAQAHYWVVPMEVELPETLWSSILAQIKCQQHRLNKGKQDG